MILDDIDTLLRPSGMMTRGGFAATPDDTLPGGARTLVLIGNAGPAMWRAFSRVSEIGSGPLDHWTREIIDPIAAETGAAALYPFTGPPYHPFQRWAMRADNVTPSPIGPLIHPEFGLWHAYRGALAFADELPLPTPARTLSVCDTCLEKPCLSTCPVDALTPGNYDVPACRDHIGGPEGTDCLERGCLARRACPVGRDYIYDPPQAEFHMRHFLHAR